jgi:cytochrome c-type biogenesis protein CcmF
MAQIGYFSLVLALLCAIYAVAASIIGLKTQTGRWTLSAANALRAIAGLFTLVVLVLLYLLIRRDFQIEYVASYTDLSLPTVYVISALWAGQKGSLLFWGWALSLCSTVFIRKYTSPPIPLSYWRGGTRGRGECNDKSLSELPYIQIVLALVLGFFLTLQIFAENPFRQLPFLPFDGNGLNPLLQNPYMVMHPPILFLGYAGFIVPFALAMAVLCTGVMRDDWVKTVRRWTLFSWYFLGLGILLGAHWAYLELGWGGYWAWDPVENASLIPWLTSTALIHTLILQHRKGFLKRWNIVLCIFTFGLCIFGTYVTRSGILASVHAFSQSPIGYYFLAFLTGIVLSVAGLLTYRWTALRSHSEAHSLLSKESCFFLANQLFVGLGLAVFYGTLYPFIAEIITGKQVMFGSSFFTMVSVPIGLVLLGLIGICQRIAWRKASLGTLGNILVVPLAITTIGTILIFVLGMKNLLALLTCSLGLFVFATICADIGKTLLPKKSVKTHEKKPLIITFQKIRQKHRDAGYIFHLGVVFIFIGIAVSSMYRLEQETELQPGESSTLGNIRFQYERLNTYKDARKNAVLAEVAIYRNGKKIAIVTPEKRFYGQSPNVQMTTEIGLHSSLKEDIYIILTGWREDQTAMFTFIIHPLILWIWVGGFVVFTIGILRAMIPGSGAIKDKPL